MTLPRAARMAVVVIGLGLSVACGGPPIAGQPTAALPAATPSASASASPTASAAATCGTATTKDSTGAPLAGDYATVVQHIQIAARQHDYQALATLMDSPFIYGPNDQSAAPSTVIKTWKASYPSGKNLNALAKAMTVPPTLDQGGYTFTSGGATVTFARLHRANPWTEFVYRSTAVPVQTAPVQTACPTPAVLKTAMAKAQPNVTRISHRDVFWRLGWRPSRRQ